MHVHMHPDCTHSLRHTATRLTALATSLACDPPASPSVEPALIGALAELGTMGWRLADGLADPAVSCGSGAEETWLASVAEWASLAELALALAACSTALQA